MWFTGAASSNLIWRVTAIINEEEVTVMEIPLATNAQPGIEYEFSLPLQFGAEHEGVRQLTLLY